MNGKGKKAMALMLALGFFASFLAIGAPAGATGGRAATFSVNVDFLQDDLPTTVFDLNVGPTLKVNITITNTGDNATGCFVNLSYEDAGGLVDLNSWSGQTINNDTPLVLTYDFDWMMITAPTGNKFWVEVTDGVAQTNSSEDITIHAAMPTVGVVDAQSTNAQNSSMCVLGVDNMTVNVTITNDGNYKMMNAQLSLFLDGTDFLVQMDIPDEIAPAAEKTYSMSTNVSGATFGMHTITANASEGMLFSVNMSNEFEIVEAKSDVILTGFEFDPMAVTIHKGETVPVTMTAHLLNNGTADAASATVHFLDGLTDLNVTVTEAIAARATLDVIYVYNITDAIALGNHTLAVGVDTQAEPNYWLQQNLTVSGKANVTVTNLTVDKTSGYEGDKITFTAVLFNNGTDNAVDLMVSFSEVVLMGIGMPVGNATVTVAKGASANAVFVYTLPNITDAQEVQTIRAGVGDFILTSWQALNITINKKLPKIEFTSIVIPTNLRRYDDTVFNLTVKNTGLVNATGVVIKITQAGGIYCITEPFNLSVNEVKTIRAEITIMEAGDTCQTFIATATVGGVEFSKNATVYVLHNIYAIMSVTALKITPGKLENQPKDSTQTFKAVVTLKNRGEKDGIVNLTIMDGTAKKVLSNQNVTVPANASKDVTISIKIKGEGTHKIGVLIQGIGVDSLNATKESKCDLKYSPGFEAVVLVGAVMVAIVLLRRRKN